MISTLANLEFIKYTSFREVIEHRNVCWVHDRLARPIDKLPQIFWDSGEPWHEANHWALTKATSTIGGDIKTVTSLMKHLVAYASWLESLELDWRHFPLRRQDRVVVLYRGELIVQRDSSLVSSDSVIVFAITSVEPPSRFDDFLSLQRQPAANPLRPL